ncbi:2-polyprenyl-6-methoxyphenol hydroxylase [Micromonospora phaseoli]|uniref:2-polyprenyl-6-methoxyphenol hydroxylase n=1 Tax=Micromonospora phaseoli TaxID=1144548 RepID=A0A1H7BUL1_9ACTN|nr:FAD-dependent oxidoreductase [Micromonospora phaseoli]PZV92828.1 2-polyprenyl-6-methoxyphenol hydroxylase-like FAD-dependent oxidoreductase [Micromonospora phaseoli]GIJ76516.1 FAD-binding monooxygenase [Micromonospora phaseoli]SEJ81141.1 2-polyprenyl-6-methoxyphenol hydroxylase [Micromonospora phaseoli]
MTQLGARAVVLGGSMGGVLAARVLAESYAEVVVVERDRVLGVSTPRRGAPHTVHAHGLHARGHLILEELFPGLTQELRDAGVPTGDLGEMRWFFNGRRIQPARTGLVSVTAPRPVLENHVRNRVAATANVTLVEECDVLGLVTTGDHEQVVGVRVRRRTDQAETEVLDADLVVDATGRGSRTPAWLDELGFQRPEEERVKVGLAYTTRHYRIRPDMFDGVQSINPVASPAHPRGAFFGQVAPDVCILSLTGVLGDYPPTDPDAFLEFVRSLPVADVYEAVRDAEALDEAVSFRFPASVRRRYDRLLRFPARLLVVGDAFCSFNPVYGQGMSVAAIQAMTLRSHLRLGRPPEPHRFFADLSRVVDTPWDISAGGDLDFPGVEGRRNLKVRIGNAYMARLQYAATKDPEVTNGFMRVAGLMDPPQALMRPAMVRRVLRHAIRRPGPGPSWRDATPPGSGVERGR